MLQCQAGGSRRTLKADAQGGRSRRTLKADAQGGRSRNELAHSVPSLFRQSREDDGRQPPLTIDQLPGQDHGLECECWPLVDTPDNTQIYEGTNQIQRVVMARQLLKG
jgi:hypothetical protein